MVGSILQLAPHPGKKSQEIVTEHSRKSAVDETKHRATPPSSIAHSITHALPGQVGFCVPRIAEDPEYIQRLQALLKEEQWVTSERVNSAAGSIVITYKSGVMPDSEMRSHLASLIQSASDAVVGKDSTVASNQQVTQESANSSSHFQPATHLEESKHRATQPSRIAYSKSKHRATQPSRIAHSITHALPGQVGFCVPRIAEDPEYIQRLQALLKEEQWVTSERVNSAAGSIVITYKSGVMPDSEMRSHLASLIQSASDAVVGKDSTVASNQQVTQESANSSSHFQPATHLDESKHRATQPSRIAYSIVHAIPGRVRFRVPKIAQDPEYVKRLEALLKRDPWVIRYRVNHAAGSIVMLYKSGVMLDSEMHSHLASLIQSASDAVVATGSKAA